jgi:hypothetical protein
MWGNLRFTVSGAHSKGDFVVARLNGSPRLAARDVWIFRRGPPLELPLAACDETPKRYRPIPATTISAFYYPCLCLPWFWFVSHLDHVIQVLDLTSRDGRLRLEYYLSRLNATKPCTVLGVRACTGPASKADVLPHPNRPLVDFGAHEGALRATSDPTSTRIRWHHQMRVLLLRMERGRTRFIKAIDKERPTRPDCRHQQRMLPRPRPFDRSRFTARRRNYFPVASQFAHSSPSSRRAASS